MIQKETAIELHHTGLIYFIYSVDQSGYDPSTFSKDVEGCSWMNKDLVALKDCSPLLIKDFSLSKKIDYFLFIVRVIYQS